MRLWKEIMQNNEQFYRQISCFDDVTAKTLENSGLRLTIQRRHIIEILFRSQYSTPKEVWCEARKFIPDLGIATVYRLINRLEQIGVLAKARNLGMAQVTPKLGVVTDQHGEVINVKKRITLEELVRIGMISYGVINTQNQLALSLVGNKVNVSLIS